MGVFKLEDNSVSARAVRGGVVTSGQR